MPPDMMTRHHTETEGEETTLTGHPLSSPGNRENDIFTIALNPHLPSISGVQGRTHYRLRNIFERRVERNNECLKDAPITRHGWHHMDTIAHANLQLSEILGFDREKTYASTLALRFHDVGYDFPEGCDPRKRGKETHKEHPKIGAEMFLGTLRRQMKHDRRINKELWWWGSQEDNLAYDTILYHSNGAAYDPEEVADEAKVGRLFDKLDNSEQRVYSEQIVACAAAAGMNINYIQDQLIHNARTILNDEPTSLPEICHRRIRRMPYMHDDLLKFDSKYEHRLVPYAITGQEVTFDRTTGSMSVDYTVVPQRVSRVLGIGCSNEDFMKLFDKAYGTTSMRHAAEVIHSIRMRVLGLETDIQDPALTVNFHFPHKIVETKEYTPLLHEKNH